MIQRNSLIVMTGQRWKLYVLYVLTALALYGALSVLIPPLGELITQSREAFLGATGVLGVVWIGWFACAVRCPACGRRIGWWYLNHTGVTNWYTDFARATECPYCTRREVSRPL